MLSCGSRSENQRWGSKVEASWADSSQLGEGSVLGSWRPEKILKPVVKTAGGCLRQEVEGQRRASTFLVEGCIVTTHHLSLPR